MAYSLTDDRTTAAEALAPLKSLDLAMIKMKLMDVEEGEGWDSDYCDRVEAEYRRYLMITCRYPEKPIVPSKIVDTFWHYHILDTQAYVADCDQILGFFLHHYPYFGMRGPEDAQALGDAYDATLELYSHHFGEPPADLWARTGSARCPNCGNRCK